MTELTEKSLHKLLTHIIGLAFLAIILYIALASKMWNCAPPGGGVCMECGSKNVLVVVGH